MRGALKFLIKIVICRLTFLREVISWDPDIIHAHDLATLPCGVSVAKKFGIRLLYDAHEYERGRNPPLSSLHKKIVTFTEHNYCKDVAQVITVSEEIADRLRLELPHSSVSVIYNSPEISDKAPEYNVRLTLGLADEVPLIIYVGGIIVNRGIESLISALIYLPNFQLVCIGPDHFFQTAELESHSRRIGVNNRVHFMKPVPHAELVSFIKTANVGVYAIKNICESYDFSMPNKLFEMAFARLPLAVSNLTSVRKMLQKYHIGETFDQDSPIDIAEKIRFVYENREKYGLSDSQYKEFYDEYSWESQKQKLTVLYENVIRDVEN